MSWIDDINKRISDSISKKKELGLTEKVIKRKQAQWEGGKAQKGKKRSDETKALLSESHIGMVRSKESVLKSNIGIKKTKWEQTLARLSKQDILDAQLKHGNHQNNSIKELGVSFLLYKKLCKHYGIELKKSNYEKTEWARETQSEEVNVYKYDKTKEDNIGEYIGTYYSIAEGCRQLDIEKCRAHAVSVANGKRNHTNGYVFKKIV